MADKKQATKNTFDHHQFVSFLGFLLATLCFSLFLLSVNSGGKILFGFLAPTFLGIAMFSTMYAEAADQNKILALPIATDIGFRFTMVVFYAEIATLCWQWTFSYPITITNWHSWVLISVGILAVYIMMTAFKRLVRGFFTILNNPDIPSKPY